MTPFAKCIHEELRARFELKLAHAEAVSSREHFPVSVVTLHALPAVTTVILVLLTALKVDS